MNFIRIAVVIQHRFIPDPPFERAAPARRRERNAGNVWNGKTGATRRLRGSISAIAAYQQIIAAKDRTQEIEVFVNAPE
jgi:hypothetical protein